MHGERSVHLTDLGWVVFEERHGELVPLPGGPYSDEQTAHRAMDPPDDGAAERPE